MRAVAFFAHSLSLDAYRVADVPAPELGPDEVLVRVHYAAINRLDDFVRVLDEAGRKHGNVHQTILVDSDVDECTEVGDVRDDAFQQHSGFEILELLDAILEIGDLEVGSRIAPRLLQFLQDVAHRRQAEGIVGVARRVNA